MKCKNVVKLLGYGNEGKIDSADGISKTGYVYSIMDFVQGFSLSDLNKFILELGEANG